MNPSTFLKTVMLASAALGLAGCVSGASNFCDPAEFKRVFHNYAYMAGLYPEQEATDVLYMIGRPDYTSRFILKDGRIVDAWFYQAAIEGGICRGFEGPYKYQPVFVSEGRVIGVTHEFYNNVLARHVRSVKGAQYNPNKGGVAVKSEWQENF